MGDAQVVRLASVTSTQDVARELPVGSIVVADHQTAGRGRLDRRWNDEPASALLVSFVVERRPLLSLAAGVAAARACGGAVRLKWPNDLLLGSRKLGGILVETTPGKAICGIGINLTWAPDGAAQLGEPREAVFERLRREMEDWTRARDERVLREWRALSATLGRRVRVDLGDRVIEGTATDLGSRGELMVDGEAVVAGSVTHL